MAVAVSSFKATGIYPINPNVFTDEDFLAADELLAQAETSLPIIANTKMDSIEQLLEPPIPNTRNTPSTINETHQQNLLANASAGTTSATRLTFNDFVPLPSTSKAFVKPNTREKQRSEVLTSTPKKRVLELALAKKRAKELEKENSRLKKQSKELLKKFGATKAIKKEKGEKTKKRTKKTKPKCRKSLVMETDSEEDNFSINENDLDLCDDDELDYIPGVDIEETCFICGEFGRDGEEWFRCTSCGLWVHSLCSGSDSPVKYVCDNCLKSPLT